MENIFEKYEVCLVNYIAYSFLLLNSCRIIIWMQKSVNTSHLDTKIYYMFKNKKFFKNCFADKFRQHYLQFIRVSLFIGIFI